MIKTKLIDFARALKKASDEGRVPWQTTGNKNAYEAALTQSSVKITMVPGEYDEENYSLTIHNSEGIEIERIWDSQMQDDNIESSIILQNLYDIARRVARKIDATLDEMLRELQGLEPYSDDEETEDSFALPPFVHSAFLYLVANKVKSGPLYDYISWLYNAHKDHLNAMLASNQLQLAAIQKADQNSRHPAETQTTIARISDVSSALKAALQATIANLKMLG